MPCLLDTQPELAWTVRGGAKRFYASREALADAMRPLRHRLCLMTDDDQPTPLATIQKLLFAGFERVP